MKQEKGDDVFFTTMFDFYKLPADFPGFEAARLNTDPYEKIKIIEEQLLSDISSPRFISYIQLHEYETLLFAGLNKFHHYYIEHARQIAALKEEVADIINPELINEKPKTAPSKRITKHLPSYFKDKTSAGPIIAEHIGLEVLRAKCQHFNSWVLQLEQLNNVN